MTDAFHWRTHSPCASWILCYWQKLVLIGMSYTIHWYFRAKSDGLVISKKWFVFRWNHKSAAVLMPGLMWRCAKRSWGRTCWGRRLVSHRIFLILMPFLALVMSERGLSRLSTCGIFERWHVESGLLRVYCDVCILQLSYFFPLQHVAYMYTVWFQISNVFVFSSGFLSACKAPWSYVLWRALYK